MDWKEHGVKIVHAGELDMNTPQTSGMTRAAAITHARTGAEKLWAGTMVVQPDAKTGPHHHGELETVLYVVKGRVRMRWGDHLELREEARAGDFIYVPPYVPHQEINGSPDEICEAVVVRSGQTPVVINLDVETPEPASAGHQGCRSIPAADAIAEIATLCKRAAHHLFSRPRIDRPARTVRQTRPAMDGNAQPSDLGDATSVELFHDSAGRSGAAPFQVKHSREDWRQRTFTMSASAAAKIICPTTAA